MIKGEKKFKQLVGEVEKIFQQGLVLSNDVLHFIDSTFSNPSVKEFAGILEDESNLERESLIALVFSPDESMQVQLENLLIEENFEKEDEKEIIDLLCSKKLSTHIIFPDNRGKLKVNIPNEMIAAFVLKLNITWKPDKQILNALNQRSEKTAVMVRMRNRQVRLSGNKLHPLCLFLEKADLKNSIFFNCLDYLLDTMDGLSDTDDIFETLSQRKHQYSDYLRKREEFEALLSTSNMETLSLQGITAPFVNIHEMRKRIEIIDTITLAVYGNIVYCL